MSAGRGLRKRRRLRASVVTHRSCGVSGSTAAGRIPRAAAPRADREPGDARDWSTRSTEATAADVRRAVAAPRRSRGTGAGMPALERGELLHEAAGLMRADRAELSALLTREGGKPRIENLDEVEWCAACFQYYAEIARNSHGVVDPADGRASDQLHHQGAARRRRGDRAVQLSAAAAGLEDRAGARRRQHRRDQAVGADAAGDAADGRARRWRTCRPASSTS